MKHLHARRIPYKADKTEADYLGPILHGNRKITMEFKKLLDELISILGKGNELSKEAIKKIFCVDDPEYKEIIIRDLSKIYPEKESKIVNIINQLEPFITAEYPLIKEIIDKETITTYRNGPAVKRMLIESELRDFVIENKYTDNFRFSGDGAILDLDVYGNVINMDDN